jgi:TIR domain
LKSKGKNLANPQIFKSALYSFESASVGKPCIFLSHTRLDKNDVINIGNYIMEAGFNIYLDIYDSDLQRAADSMDHDAITECLERGIANSTHMLCFLSEKTKRSWWVPYEIGYGKSREKHIATLLLKDFDLDDIPSFLYISEVLEGIKSLNDYIEKINLESQTLLEKYSSADTSPNIIAHTESHPLDNYLKWKY